MLKLQPTPTFKCQVSIPVPGQDSAKVELVFKHMTRTAFDLLMSGEGSRERADIDTVMAFVCGWEGVEAAFSREAMAELLENYHGAASAISTAYASELVRGRLGN
jgi:hypothetical protein